MSNGTVNAPPNIPGPPIVGPSTSLPEGAAGPSHADASASGPAASGSVQFTNTAEEPLPAGWEMRYDVYGRR